MKKSLLLVVLALFLALRSSAAVPSPIETFRAGLHAFQTNGPDALLSTWYSGDTETKLPELRAKLAALSGQLGAVVDTEAFDPRMLGKRVTRLYGVIYFQKRPLWIRADYYVADGAGGFISLEFSEHPEDILPLFLK